jgi:hypothetical protein
MFFVQHFAWEGLIKKRCLLIPIFPSFHYESSHHGRTIEAEKL